MKSPLARVKEITGLDDNQKAKDKLIDMIGGVLPAGDESKEDRRKRLLAVANGKLLKLFGVATRLKKDYGTHDKLVDAVAAHLGRSRDKDYVEKLSRYSTARLLDIVTNQASPTKTAASSSAPAGAEPSKAPKASAAAKTTAKSAKANAGGKSPARAAKSGTDAKAKKR